MNSPRSPRTQFLTALCAAMLAVTGAAAAHPERAFAIRARAIYPVTRQQPCAIENATMIIRGGKIVALGRGLEVPPGMQLIDLPDSVICPGFVAASANLAQAHGGDETVSGAYRAVDAFDTYADYKLALSQGVTTVHLDAGEHRLISGVGAVVKLGGPAPGRVLNPEASLCINFDAFSPPALVSRPFYASSDEQILPAKRQRPESRLGRMVELNERIGSIAAPASGGFDYHSLAFAQAWQDQLPLRLRARRAADIRAALDFLKQARRPGYLVGVAEGDRVVADLVSARLPLVLKIEREFRFPGNNIGADPDPLRDELGQIGAMSHSELQIALAGTDGPVYPQMLGALAMRGGMTAAQALAGLTRAPAEILGIGDRLGTLEPGRDADFLVMTGPPLEIGSSVLATYIDGEPVFQAPQSGAGAVVIRGGTIWVGNGQIVRDGSLLIRDGKIASVGQRVPTPPFARVINAGASAFITPGFIDANSHLGLEEDRTNAGPDLPIDMSVGAATREFVRVARAGVTTALLSPYRVSSSGARIAAIKTAGDTDGSRVTRAIAGLRLEFREQDPLTGADSIRQLFERGRKYAESWKKYHEELEKWKADQAAGRTTTTTRPATEDTTEIRKSDPISGTWDFTISGGPLPESISGTMRLRLTGNSIEGRATIPMSEEEVVLKGTLEGDSIELQFDEETEIGAIVLKGRLDREDHIAGKFKVGDVFELDFEATRTSREAVEFKVTRKRRSKTGGPVAPNLDEALEPVRAVLEDRAPVVLSVRDAAQARAVVKLLVDEFKVSVVLVGADEVAAVADELVSRKDKVGVVPPAEVMRWRDQKPYNQAADLASRGIRIAFQSDAEDAARNLPLVALYSVKNGLGGDEALRALTSDAAEMFKLDDRIGTLETGKDGDVLIFSGHPFDAGSRLERVLIGGQEPPPLEEAP